MTRDRFTHEMGEIVEKAYENGSDYDFDDDME